MTMRERRSRMGGGVLFLFVVCFLSFNDKQQTTNDKPQSTSTDRTNPLLASHLWLLLDSSHLRKLTLVFAIKTKSANTVTIFEYI